jgi:hypothetical protein
MFEFSPIFYDGTECQLFNLMTFFYSRKDLTCMLGSFFSQPVHVGRRRRPRRPPLFLLTAIFYKMLSKNTTRCFDKISVSQNVRLIAWYKEGISTTVTVGHLGRQGTSICSLLAQTMGLRTTPFHRVKNSTGTGQLATIKIHALKGLNAICGGKTALFCRTIKQ